MPSSLRPYKATPSKALNTLQHKEGATTVKLVSFHIGAPSLFNKDRVSPFEAKSNSKMDYVGQFTIEVTSAAADLKRWCRQRRELRRQGGAGIALQYLRYRPRDGKQDATAVPLADFSRGRIRHRRRQDCPDSSS